MKGIGGNISGQIQTRTTVKNDIGESVKTWSTIQTLTGWLDLSGGDSKYRAYNAKVQESTHIFICDFVALEGSIKAENSRMLIGGNHYDVMLIDNPMGMGEGSQLEIYLKFTGAQNG